MEAIQPVIDFVLHFYVNYAAILGAVVAVLTALIGLFMLVPGEQPEKALQVALDFIKRFSKK